MGLAKKIIIVLIAIPCVLIASIYIRNKSVGPEGWAMDDAQKKLRLHLKDPDSLVIRSAETFVTIDPKDGDKIIHICGSFDGRNSFGAYGGATRFVSRSVQYAKFDAFHSGDVVVEEADDVAAARGAGRDSGFESVYWKPNCKQS